MFKFTTEIDEKSQKALSKNVINFCIACIVIGSIGLLTYIVLGTINDNPYYDFILLFSIPFAIGLVYLVLIKKNIKNMTLKKFTNEYEFNEDHFNVTSIQNNEPVGTQKIYYKDIYKTRETDEYIFVYINKYSAYIMKKSNVESGYLSTLRAILKLSAN